MFLILLPGLLSMASAATVQVGLGQTAQINPGDVAVVVYGSQSSAVICGQGTPNFQNFLGEAIADIELFPGSDAADDERAKNWCLTIDPAYTADLKPALQRATDQAMNQCQLSGFTGCSQIGTFERQYLGQRNPNGTHQCEFKVYVRGTR